MVRASTLLVVAAVAFGTACVSGSLFYKPTPAELAEANKTPEQRFNERWAGQPESELFLQYGKPNDVIELPNGNRIDSFHKEFVVSQSRGFANGSFGVARSDSGTIYCDRRFEIQKVTLTVLRATISGNRCDYNR
jgi:hypothetical protein